MQSQLEGKVINNFITQGGRHCITNAMKQIFAFYGYSLSEPMLLGLGSGFSFGYINLAHSPMLIGRTKVFEFEQHLAKRLGIVIQCKKSQKYENAFIKTKQSIDNENPVLVYVDMPYLSYLNMGEAGHFGGHAIVIFGYDEEKKCFYISDRDNSDYAMSTPKGKIAQDYHQVSFEEMEKARSSRARPFPANNQYLTFEFKQGFEVTPHMLKEAIKANCEQMLYPAAHLLGIEGIAKLSHEVLKWKKYDQTKLRTAGITNFFQINEAGGTGGGIFRNLFGEFLIEASHIIECTSLEDQGKAYIKIADEWEEIAKWMKELSTSGEIGLLEKISKKAQIIKEEEEVTLKTILTLL